MLDARIFITELDTARKILKMNQAVFKGEYSIHDSIYSSNDLNNGIDKVFLRLRSVLKNIWNEKPFIVAIKHTELKSVGKQSVIPVKKQFDTLLEAQEFLNKTYLNEFTFLYEFSRIGWQYDIGDEQVDLEEIEGLYSIEFKSPTEEGLNKLLKLFNVNDVIKVPSVVKIKELLDR